MGNGLTVSKEQKVIRLPCASEKTAIRCGERFVDKEIRGIRSMEIEKKIVLQQQRFF